MVTADKDSPVQLVNKFCLLAFCLLPVLFAGMVQAADGMPENTVDGDKPDTFGIGQAQERPWARQSNGGMGTRQANRRGRRSQQGRGTSMGGGSSALDPSRGAWRSGPPGMVAPWMPAAGYRTAGPSGMLRERVPPRIEAELSQSVPWLHQTVLYTVRLFTDRAVKTLDTVFPTTGGIAIEMLDGPDPSVRMQGRRPEYVTEYRFAITPLRSGAISVPPIKLKGTLDTAQQWYGGFPAAAPVQGEAFDVSLQKPGMLQVRPPNPLVQPWLPLHDLQLSGEVRAPGDIQAGEPIALTVRISAIGTPGDLLPSIQSQLQNDDSRVYRDSVTTGQVLASDGMELHGTRVEYYTLIPSRGGKLNLPTLRVDWWNLDRQRAESAQLPLQSVRISGLAGSRAMDGIPTREREHSLFFVVIISALVGYLASFLITWRHMRGGLKSWKQMPGKAGVAASSVLARLVAPLAPFWRRFMPRITRQYLRYRLVLMMPPRMKLWMCSRCIEEEETPGEWCQLFQFLACKHLDLGHQAPLPEIADGIIEMNPGADAEVIRALIMELNGAMYGGKDIDFKAWKKSFRLALKPRWFQPSRPVEIKSQGLPSLNPRVL